MKKDKYKVLVLSDLNTSTIKTLKSSISIAQIVNADIDFLYVKKVTDVVEKESQLSAMRTINKEYFTTDKKIKELIQPVSELYNININHSFIIGNVKNEIEKYIDKHKPDVVVLGKRKSKFTNFIGDKIAQFILKKYKGTIVICDENNPLKPNEELSLGIFNDTKFNTIFEEDILKSSQKPIISFKISENSNNLKEEIITENDKTIEYVFEKGDNVIKNISNYLSKSNVNLLFVNRENDNHNSVTPTINDVINKLNCSLILTT
jgi:vacuolar-type H+-ATPase subunit I/STV1